MKAVAAMIACLGQPVQQEFLLDSGAGRNLISAKELPSAFKGHVFDAMEKIDFSAGGGIRPSSKVVNLVGEVSGVNMFCWKTVLMLCRGVYKSTNTTDRLFGCQVNFLTW